MYKCALGDGDTLELSIDWFEDMIPCDTSSCNGDTIDFTNSPVCIQEVLSLVCNSAKSFKNLGYSLPEGLKIEADWNNVGSARPDCPDDSISTISVGVGSCHAQCNDGKYPTGDILDYCDGAGQEPYTELDSTFCDHQDIVIHEFFHTIQFEHSALCCQSITDNWILFESMARQISQNFYPCCNWSIENYSVQWDTMNESLLILDELDASICDQFPSVDTLTH
jgi:hypothetical protein